jgi:hypothetical protein
MISLKWGRSGLRSVSQLMLPRRREWDVPLLQSLLYLHDVSEVLKIRLSDRAHEDHVAWMQEKMGIFSVTSAYRLAVRLEDEVLNTMMEVDRCFRQSGRQQFPRR